MHSEGPDEQMPIKQKKMKKNPNLERKKLFAFYDKRRVQNETEKIKRK